ncbi:MAG: hypothetical protein IKE36_12250 [Solobacterium sp.]|nr:hypothetical protein [Solobacterium sp.]
MIILEGMVMCFWLLLICVTGIANGPVGLVIFYEQDVQDRVVELGLTTKEKIRSTMILASLALFLPLFTVVPYMVYGLNEARGFREGFLQMTSILLIMGLFDRLFIDWYWVEHTKAWIIPGTEDLRPYIPLKTKIGKWAGTLIGFPLLAAILAGIVHLVFKL